MIHGCPFAFVTAAAEYPGATIFSDGSELLNEAGLADARLPASMPKRPCPKATSSNAALSFAISGWWPTKASRGGTAY